MSPSLEALLCGFSFFTASFTIKKIKDRLEIHHQKFVTFSSIWCKFLIIFPNHQKFVTFSSIWCKFLTIFPNHQKFVRGSSIWCNFFSYFSLAWFILGFYFCYFSTLHWVYHHETEQLFATAILYSFVLFHRSFHLPLLYLPPLEI